MPESGESSETADPPPRRRKAHLAPLPVLALLALALGWFWRGDDAGAVREFEVMRTYARIAIPAGSGSHLPASDLADLAEKAVREVDALMSPFGGDSDVRRLNEAPAGAWVEVNPLTWRVVMEALRWHRLSEGAFDPTIGPVKGLFQFNRTEVDSWPDAQTLAEARERVGAEKLLFDREGMRLSWERDGMILDLGAIAKGFAVDRAAEVIAAQGVKNAIIDVGGELRLLGQKPGEPPAPWRVGIRHPRDEGRTLETLELSGQAVATSGDYENFFVHQGRRYEHIIDPRSGLPLTGGAASVTVIHPQSCLAADAMATTLCVLGSDQIDEFMRRQARGLFSRGVRAIVLLVGPDGGLRRREFNLDQAGALRIEDNPVGEGE
ncbi:MAG: FAD:protein FMN transferase [Planctomycetota bacterium]|jgi:thiamine biosynthesis lipoprotein|nr:FAD:protein FMN transferase [Planctomycetota bacterium]